MCLSEMHSRRISMFDDDNERIEKSKSVSYKDDFTDIYLIFDYERQDPNFSAADIEKMQESFSDSTDMGKLYINYPMVEAYLDFNNIPDEGFLNRKIEASLKNGDEYKNRVSNSPVERMVRLPHKIGDILSEYKNKTTGDTVINSIVEDILKEPLNKNSVNKILKKIGTGIIPESDCSYVGNLIFAKVKEAYITDDIPYYQQLKDMYKYIIKSVMEKSNNIINKLDEFDEFDSQGIDSVMILKKQNEVSSDIVKGFIWVLNTSVMLVYDYNSSLIE